MTSYIVSAFSKIGMMAAVVAASLFPTSLSAQDVAGAADAAELALAGETPVLDSGNTAWLIVATVLVLLMSIPGIALFYGGLVRQKNVLSVIMQTMFIVGVVSILWVAFGYSWAFGTGFMESGNPLGAVIGGFDKAFLYGITIDTMMPSGIPELTFVMFQCMFALITPALILGAFAERIRVFGLHGVYRAVGHSGLFPDGALGVGRRLPAADGCDRFRRRNGGSHQCRYLGLGYGDHAGKKGRLPDRTSRYSA